jgi:hypothetical protein
MPSGRAKRQPEHEPVVFFLDRGLGRHVLANALRDAGHAVLTMVEVYPDGADMDVSDPDWLLRADEEGWIALTKDPAIIFDHADVLAETTLRVFAFNNASLTGPIMADRLIAHLNRILQRARKHGPYVYVITADGLELRWPRPASE